MIGAGIDQSGEGCMGSRGVGGTECACIGVRSVEAVAAQLGARPHSNYPQWRKQGTQEIVIPPIVLRFGEMRCRARSEPLSKIARPGGPGPRRIHAE